MHESQWLSAEEGRAVEDVGFSENYIFNALTSLKNPQWRRMISEISLPSRVASHVLKLSEKVYFTEYYQILSAVK